MLNITLIYGSDTGMTEEVTQTIVDRMEWAEVNVKEVHAVTKEDFLMNNILILGLSTWYDGDLQSDWEDYFDEFKTINFTGKTVAIYGLGDQYGYHEYFIDGVGILAKVILENGGSIIGYWPSADYDFTVSKAKIDGEDLFYGLALDEDNEPELTNKRIEQWVAQLKMELRNN
ncbi:MAG: flavodoxin [Bacteroidota bacterium]